jgi:hypothetical protein
MRKYVLAATALAAAAAAYAASVVVGENDRLTKIPF